MQIGNITVNANDMKLLFEIVDCNDYFWSDAYSTDERNRVYKILEALKAEVKRGDK